MAVTAQAGCKPESLRQCQIHTLCIFTLLMGLLFMFSTMLADVSMTLHRSEFTGCTTHVTSTHCEHDHHHYHHHMRLLCSSADVQRLLLQKASLNRRPSPVLLPNRRRIRTPSPSLPDSLSPHPSMHDGLAALHEAATSPERQARALSSALPSRVASTALPFYQDAPSGPQVNYNFVPYC